MDVLPSNRTGVLIVRLWVETNHHTKLRARIAQTIDTVVPEETFAVAASADDICEAVKQWVEEFTGPEPSDQNGAHPPVEPARPLKG